MKTWPTIWKSKTINVDIDTGEQISKYNAKQNYKKIKTDKHAKYTNKNRTSGLIEYTINWRHKRQGELPFTD